MVVLTFHVHIVQDPVEVDGEWNKFLGKLDYGFTCIFAIEVLLKVREAFKNVLADFVR